jgi:hypothetical protein
MHLFGATRLDDDDCACDGIMNPPITIVLSLVPFLIGSERNLRRMIQHVPILCITAYYSWIHAVGLHASEDHPRISNGKTDD